MSRMIFADVSLFPDSPVNLYLKWLNINKIATESIALVSANKIFNSNDKIILETKRVEVCILL